ncbi:hypothetical protein HL658_25530 [Azospirillum sp. RWY-5-1]|uniref:Lipoprotein n=1 Tax=Azospirillum oleiclasticum TaxID=2735135 RepID=A0ABX2TIM1_9PROT|nr:hypothetical protein [Azospirillum oleiclasticum]NYZ15916.1 hypothetical protein [Azospirillum oleiclasticum]NYZ23605.1 hypothetical protein [Azospirillum oleiclasticum]
MPSFPLRAAALSALLLTAGCAGLSPPPHRKPDPDLVSALDRLAKHRCNREAASVLTAVGMAAGDVRSLWVYTVPRYSGESLGGPEAHVGLNGQPGSVIIPMTDDCKARQVYTTGGARVPGMTGW